ncbi:hypothetical protein ONS95_006393 [Cadophora gregata]|uniref:uncharacterized protein n=1 Tax=Cadophora gregata TaxID=51156 RepID=UPI0026DA814F|nr:uncharacterized protein ONS95_006393 [Cadophora gregata]KAK0099236.1 hypothetical protein ONS96_008470 [Cadophora gregata f. sp. sojae]KAK0102796.1 hypothetical protein ONS95_006393 [Cadophora gregata]
MSQMGLNFTDENDHRVEANSDHHGHSPRSTERGVGSSIRTFSPGKRQHQDTPTKTRQDPKKFRTAGLSSGADKPSELSIDGYDSVVPGDGDHDANVASESASPSSATLANERPALRVADLHGHPDREIDSGQVSPEDEHAQRRGEQESPGEQPSVFDNPQEAAAEIAFAETQIEQEGIDLDEEPPVQQTQIRATGEDSIYNRYSEQLTEALDQGIDALIMAAMDLTGMPCDGWVAKRKASQKCHYRDLLHSLWIMVIGWDPLVLKHVVHGNLPEEENRNPELKKALRLMNENLPRNKVCPSTYANYLVGKGGVATTVDDCRSILDIGELYLSGLGKPDDDSVSHELAGKVDSALPSKVWGPRSAKEGKRRYIESDIQAGKCMEWIEATRERLRGLSADEPLERPLCEVGFAKTPHERLAQHAAHTSSNYLMNLAEAICMTHNHLSQYRIKQYVVHHLAHHTHAMYDEILASRFALVYTSQGGGFSHYPAGISHKGAEKTEKQHYNAQQELLARDPSFHKRVAEQLDKMKAVAEFYERFVEVSKQHRESIEKVALAARALDKKCDEVAEQQARERQIWAELTDPILDFMDFAEELEKDMEAEGV